MSTQSTFCLQPDRASSGNWHYSFVGKKEYFSMHTGVEIKAVTVSPNMFLFKSNVKPAKNTADNFKTWESEISSGSRSLCSTVVDPSSTCHRVYRR